MTVESKFLDKNIHKYLFQQTNGFQLGKLLMGISCFKRFFHLGIRLKTVDTDNRSLRTSQVEYCVFSRNLNRKLTFFMPSEAQYKVSSKPCTVANHMLDYAFETTKHNDVISKLSLCCVQRNGYCCSVE